MTAKIFIFIASSIFLILGTIHLVYTFFTNKFLARDVETNKKMNATSPILTKETTVWKAWIGFNASHSIGAMFIGLINIILVCQHFEVYQNSFNILLLDICAGIFYLFLAKRYWFKIPLVGILIATCCFIIALLLLLK